MTHEERDLIRKDYKIINILSQGLDNMMLNKVMNLDTSKAVCDTIAVICNGTEKVRENKLQMLMQTYEWFLHRKE